MGETLERLCAAVQQWDARSGVPDGDETGAFYVLAYVLERPAWRALVETELQELPTVASMRRCLKALSERGAVGEVKLVRELVRAVDGQLEHLSEDHAQVVRRRRRWLADALKHSEPDPEALRSTQALLSTETVWEEMRRYRVYLTVWRDVTAGLG